MIEVTSGNIQVGIRYTVSNLIDGTGYITYNTVNYYQGGSFVGQVVNDIYSTSDTNMKVYEDDTLTDVITSITSEVGDEISPYPESTLIIQQVTVENFSENEDVVFPENTIIKSQITASESAQTITQIIRKTKKYV